MDVSALGYQMHFLIHEFSTRPQKKIAACSTTHTFHAAQNNCSKTVNVTGHHHQITTFLIIMFVTDCNSL